MINPKAARVHNVDAMEVRLTVVIEQKMGNLATTSASENIQTNMFFDFCNGGHPNHECQSMVRPMEQVDFVWWN